MCDILELEITDHDIWFASDVDFPVQLVNCLLLDQEAREGFGKLLEDIQITEVPQKMNLHVFSENDFQASTCKPCTELRKFVSYGVFHIIAVQASINYVLC